VRERGEGEIGCLRGGRATSSPTRLNFLRLSEITIGEENRSERTLIEISSLFMGTKSLGSPSGGRRELQTIKVAYDLGGLVPLCDASGANAVAQFGALRLERPQCVHQDIDLRRSDPKCASA
jgi:hypothetical protein